MFKRYSYNQPHPFEQLHGFILQAFETMMNADKNTSFDDIIGGFEQEFQELVRKEKTNKSDCLYKPMKEIFALLQTEAANDKQQLMNALNRNNKIADICRSKEEPLITYDDIISKSLKNKLKIFLNKLYEVYFNRAAFIRFATTKAKELGWPEDTVDLKHHFNGLVTQSKMQVCPFCGLNHLQNRFNNGRNAYDHYLPKGNIPFISVNFWNLVPMCDDCNSKNKGEKVPVFSNGTNRNKRVKAFYPFDDAIPEFRIRFSSVTHDKAWDEISPVDITMHVDSEFEEEVGSWMVIFGIESRYKAKVLGDLKLWLESLFTKYHIEKVELKKSGILLSWPMMLEIVMKTYLAEWSNDHNFLKYALFKYLLDEHNLLQYLEAYEAFQAASGPVEQI